MRCPILIGRQEPAALIDGMLRRLARPGRGSALVVAGEAGIGKSRLAEHMSLVAARAGVRVVTGRAMPAGIGGPLGPVAEVILDVTRGRPAPADADLAPYLAVLASLVPHWRRPGWSAPAEPVLVMAEAVLRILHWAAGGQGVALVIEDLHWADDATLAVTRYLVSHADEVAVALLATVRTGEGLRILNELGTVEMLRDARGERLEQARAEALRVGAVGLAVGIGANLAVLLAMTARFEDVMDVAGEVEGSARRLGLVPLQAAALLMQGFALAHQGRVQEMERHLSAAEALAPGDQDLRAGAWGIGRALCALLAEDRDGARQALARARQEAPDQHARILNPYEGPELLLRAVAGQARRGEIDAAAASIVKAARWPELWFRAAQAVAAAPTVTPLARKRPSPRPWTPDPATRSSPPWCGGSSRRPPSAITGAHPTCCCARRTPRSPGSGSAARRPLAGYSSRPPDTPRRGDGPPTRDFPPPSSPAV